MKAIPRGRPILYKEVRGTSGQRTFYLEGTEPVEETGRPTRGPPAKSPPRSPVGKAHREPGALASMPLLPPRAAETPQASQPPSVWRHRCACGPADGLSASGQCRWPAHHSAGRVWAPSRARLAWRAWWHAPPCPVVAEVGVAQSHAVRQRPGKKTDEREAPWIAALRAPGLSQPSFVPPPALRA
jgi:hypothetical protein